MIGYRREHVGAHVIIRTVLLSQLLVVGTVTTTTTTSRSLTDVQMGCYTCTSTEELENTCETDPSSLPHSVLKSCPREVCTIVRVEEWPSGRVKSFYRGCDGRSRVFERDHCHIEKNERTCFTACVGDLCNVGNGVVSSNAKSTSNNSRKTTFGQALFVTFPLSSLIGRLRHSL